MARRVPGDHTRRRARSGGQAGARRWRCLRQGVQLASLLAFTSILIYANAQRPARFWPDVLVRLDPLLVAGASLAGRALVGGALLASAILLLTLLFGRAWCGWLCPLGTLLEWLGPRRHRPGRRAPAEGWRAAKVLLLAAVAVLALFGSQVLTWLDPITIFTRTFTLAAWPAARHAAAQAEAFLYRFPVLWAPLDAVHGAVVQPLFQDVQPVFALGLLAALFFAGLVALNWIAPRFWCRALCPLGGLLGLVSRWALVRREVRDDCAACMRCACACPTGTIDPERGYRSDPAECIVCLDCLVACTRDAQSFRLQVPGWRPAPRQAYDPSRRALLAAGSMALAGAALAGVEPVTKRSHPHLLRPPGADLVDFNALCVRCGACVRVCPTQGLQPSLFEAGVQGFLTPRLVPRLGACSFSCTACGQVCPTGAVPRLALEDKQATPIGLARIDRDRCLPWAYDTPCIVCEEACPIADKAIVLDEVEVVGPQGWPVLLQRPRVVKERCIGCGICENKCPLGGEAAVRVCALSDPLG
ncbi:MAG: 4Fe-4S binding protein [Anaerolineae bacterium]|nr:4Fe-4S binding protein [Anaerolineae bacterium]